MERQPPLLLLGVATHGAPGLPAVRAGRVTGLLAGRGHPRRLPAAALRLPQPLGFGGLAEVRAWLMAREARLAAALRALGGCREVGLELREDPPRHAAWLRARDHGLQAGAPADPARAARLALVALRLETILASEARSAILPEPARAPARWSVAVPDSAVERLHAALELEARKLAGTGLSLHLRGRDESDGLARAVLQDG